LSLDNVIKKIFCSHVKVIICREHAIDKKNWTLKIKKLSAYDFYEISNIFRKKNIYVSEDFVWILSSNPA